MTMTRPWDTSGDDLWVYKFRHVARLRDEMTVCQAGGIPHSSFLDWPDEDQEKAVAWVRYQRECCQGCGVHPSEWAYRDDGTIDEDDPPFEARLSSCLGCRLTGDARKDVPSERAMAVRAYLMPRRRDVDKTPEELEAEFAELLADADADEDAHGVPI